MNKRASGVGTFEVFEAAHVTLRQPVIMATSQLDLDQAVLYGRNQ